MTTEEGLSRLTVDIPAGLHRKLKVLAAQKGTEIRALVIYALNEAFTGGVRQVSREELDQWIPSKPKKGGKS